LRLLLDTHIWLWSLAAPKRLSGRVRKEITDSSNELWLSPLSMWEALLLHGKGRLVLPAALGDWIETATGHFREAPLTFEIVVAANQLPFHQGPADRFLAATSDVLGLIVVTADRHLVGLGKIATLAN
jgi:PIN domain nuclease of toxin-antitoxin system